MELRAYGGAILRKWWMVAGVLVIALVVTAALTYSQQPVYRSTATFVVAPVGSADVQNSFYGIDTLSRQAEIAGTYMQVADSQLIKGQAARVLNLSQSQQDALSVSSRLRGGSNVIEIAVEGDNPTIVRDFANTVGAQTIKYAQDVYAAYGLKPLDGAIIPTAPARPAKKLNLLIGALAGLILGSGLALFSEYLQEPVSRPVAAGEGEPGLADRRRSDKPSRQLA